MTGIPVNEGPASSLYSVAVQAAAEGAGILMAHETLTMGPVAAGALVAPFPVRATTGLSLQGLAPDHLPSQTIRMIDWLIGRVQLHAG